MTVYFTNNNGAEFEYNVPDLDDGVVYVPGIHIKPSTRKQWTWPQLITFVATLVMSVLLTITIWQNFLHIAELQEQNRQLETAVSALTTCSE